MVTEILFSLPPPTPPTPISKSFLFKARLHDATKTCDHATCVKIALCKRAYCDMRLSQESWMISTFLQQSHVAQISPFTQRDFVARRISHQFLSHRVNAPLRKRKRIPRLGNHLILQSVIYNIYICIIAVPYQGSSPMLKQAELKDSRFVKDLQSQPHPSLRHRHLY